MVNGYSTTGTVCSTYRSMSIVCNGGDVRITSFRDVAICIWGKCSLKEEKVNNCKSKLNGRTSKIRRISSRSNLQAVTTFLSCFARNKWRERRWKIVRLPHLTTYLWIKATVLRLRTLWVNGRAFDQSFNSRLQSLNRLKDGLTKLFLLHSAYSPIKSLADLCAGQP